MKAHEQSMIGKIKELEERMWSGGTTRVSLPVDRGLSNSNWQFDPKITDTIAIGIYNNELAVVADVTIKPIKGFPLMRHPEHEWLLILEGSGIWVSDRNRFLFHKGQMIYVPPMIEHGIQSGHEETIHLLSIQYPGTGDYPEVHTERDENVR